MPHYGHPHLTAALPLAGGVARQAESTARKAKSKVSRRKPATDALLEHERQRDLGK